jgi:predicted transcriptional regulator
MMNRPAAITARVDENTAIKLDQLADQLDRSRSWLIAKAVQEYVERETELLEMIRAGENDLAAGRVHTQEEMEAWLDEQLSELATKRKAAA